MLFKDESLCAIFSEIPPEMIPTVEASGPLRSNVFRTVGRFTEQFIRRLSWQRGLIAPFERFFVKPLGVKPQTTSKIPPMEYRILGEKELEERDADVSRMTDRRIVKLDQTAFDAHHDMFQDSPFVDHP